MTESGSTGQVRPTEDPTWAAGPEIPDADADEQRRDLVDDPEDADPETVVGRDPGDRLAELPLEVSEADLAEQLTDVPFDEDADRA